VFAESAGKIEELFVGWNLIPAERQRIMVIAPPSGEIQVEDPPGCIFYWGTYSLRGNQRSAAQWGGGMQIYWPDEVEPFARKIVAHLKTWGHGEPKSKEDVTAALNVLHENSSLIVEGLKDVGAIKAVGANRFISSGLDDVEEESRLSSLAVNQDLLRQFRWIGYEINCAVRYMFFSEEDAKRVVRIRTKNRLTFPLSVLGCIVSLIGALIGIAALILWLRS
jgi:hypothetical protein